MKKGILILFVLASGAVFGQKLPDNQPVEKKEERKVAFFPNPATTYITFEFKETLRRGTQIQMYSFLGRQVKSIQATAQKMTVNISDLNRGIYVFQVRDPEGRIIESNKFQVAQ